MLKPQEEILDLELAQPLDLPPRKANSLEVLLDEQEEILWEGAPDTSLLKYETTSAKPFFINAVKTIGLFVGVICIMAFIWGLFSVGDNITFEDLKIFVYMVLFGSVVLFVVGFIFSIGIYLIIALLEEMGKNVHRSYRSKIEKMSYYYTQKQLIFKKGSSYQSLPFQHIEKINFLKEVVGSRTIGFIIKNEYQKNAIRTKNLLSKEKRSCPTFELLPNVGEVLKEISAVWEIWKTKNNA